MKQILRLLIFIYAINTSCQDVAILKYSGGGDWYSNPTAVPNLIAFTNLNCHTAIDKSPKTVNIGDDTILNFPIVFLTGHGHISLSNNDIENLRNYLMSGGFLHISDNYGLDKYIRKELKKVFPSQELQEIPNNHPIYHQTFKFENGIPKIHEHDKKPAQGLGLFYKGRLVVFYDYETDLSDGWEDQSIHNNPEKVRETALKMGANIIEYAFKH